MFSDSNIQLFSIIGQIQKNISASATFDEAVRSGLDVILKSGLAHYAIIWYSGKDEPNTVRPYYWICPRDLSLLHYALGEGMVGKTALSGETTVSESAEAGDAKRAKDDLRELKPSSIICISLLDDDQGRGCMELVKTEGVFDAEEASVCEMLALIVQMALAESAPHPDASRKEDILLSLHGITKSFDDGEEKNRVLRGIDFDVFEGEFLCLLGESGCGKSTVLNIIGGLLAPDEGTVTFRGRALGKLNRKELTRYRRDSIGFVFQAYNLMPNMTVLQNLDFIAALIDKPLDSRKALALVGLEQKSDAYPSKLSGGQQQRAAIARALVKRPPLILADEPLAALDYHTGIEVLSVFEEVVKQGTTLVMVTHNEEVAKMADRVISFRQGRTYKVSVNYHPLSARDLVW